MIINKLYKYDSTQENNNYRGEDFSKYILSGDEENDKLDQTLAEYTITLEGLPFKKEFDPSTKFILEKYGNNFLYKSYDLVVHSDLVSQPILSDNNYFTHAITFYEPSVIAQNRLVDNISVTYKLQDVSLLAENTINLKEKAKVSISNATFTPPEDFARYFGINYAYDIFGYQYIWKFPTRFTGSDAKYNHNEKEWTEFPYYREMDANTTQQISIPLPMLNIYQSVYKSKNFALLGLCSIATEVYETNLSTNTIQIVETMETNPTTLNEYENNWNEKYDASFLEKGVIKNRRYLGTVIFSNSQGNEYHEKRVSNHKNVIENREIKFNIKPNCVYEVMCRLKNFKTPEDDKGHSDYDYNKLATTYSYSHLSGLYGVFQNGTNSYEYTTELSPLASLSFRTFVTGDATKTFFKSAPPANAYDLFTKAQITTQIVDKKESVAINDSELTFYVSDSDKAKLLNTKIVENFYNQKNLWEILLEIGKYIHAIPKIEFGKNDRFLVKWKSLGDTQVSLGTDNKITIFNSRNMEDYISSCSSYITNMVQLGGVIDEWLAPKSSSEDYLVYNDVANIQTSKKIIEIVDMEIKCIRANDYNIPVGEVRNLAGKGTKGESKNGYVFSKNIYDVLPIDVGELCNKGLAIYYELGTNIINGFTYQLPVVSAGDVAGDYAIKRIIGSVYKTISSTWRNIKVNDFVFHIIYRTSDSIRSDQTRPDLRKYLMNSKYDIFPQHYQFNNQTDIVVDSIKYGNKVYGELVRTGNTSYSIKEWNNSIFNLKQIGQLYKIDNDLYYVSTIKNTFYQDLILSEITYSKDYNELSQIIGIPSEPRFYEISEQSSIQREVAINQFLILGTSENKNILRYISGAGWSYLHDLLLKDNIDYPKYAITSFKNDINRKYGNVINNETFSKDICSPISAYSIRNTLTLEWDMLDNFSAGDRVKKTDYSLNNSKVVDTQYNTLLPTRYTDSFGRCDLFDFYIMKDFQNGSEELTSKEIMNLPLSPLRTGFDNYKKYVSTIKQDTFPTPEQLSGVVNLILHREPMNGDGIVLYYTLANHTSYFLYTYVFGVDSFIWLKTQVDDPYTYEQPYIEDYLQNIIASNHYSLNDMGTHTKGLALLKDNREVLSFNFNIQMLTDSDRFVLSSSIWQQNKKNVRLALLSEEMNKLSADTFDRNKILENGIFDVISSFSYGIDINVSQILKNADLTNAKCIVLFSDTILEDFSYSNNSQFVIARNITGLTKEEAIKDWFISPIKKDMFKAQ